jgi:ribosome-binding protein aMBF1 (putative translation factor)
MNDDGGELPISKVIARARHRKRLTQVQLAEQIGVNKLTVVGWEVGRHYPQRHIGRLEEALGIDLSGYERDGQATAARAARSA